MEEAELVQVSQEENVEVEPVPLSAEDKPRAEEEVEEGEMDQYCPDSEVVQEDSACDSQEGRTLRDRPSRGKRAPVSMSDYVVKHLSKGRDMLCLSACSDPMRSRTNKPIRLDEGETSLQELGRMKKRVAGEKASRWERMWREVRDQPGGMDKSVLDA